MLISAVTIDLIVCAVRAKLVAMDDIAIIPPTDHWARIKALVLDTVASVTTRRVYEMALNEFLARDPTGARTRFFLDQQSLVGDSQARNRGCR